MTTRPSWPAHVVAHRGESADFPENTLLAMQSALQNGANYLECDIQLSQDAQAMVIHDSRMGRTTACRQGRVWDYSSQMLRNMSAGYEERFAKKFSDENIPTLQALVDLLRQWPQAHVFVELKRASLAHFGHSVMLDAVMPSLAGIDGRYTIISYDFDVLQHVKSEYRQAVGWVSDNVDDEVIARADQLAPEFLITDADSIDKKYLTNKAGWRWMLFEVNEPAAAQAWLAAGVDFIETNRVANYFSQS